MLNAKGFLTMVMHIILPMLYAVKCLLKYQPDIFYDTTGRSIDTQATPRPFSWSKFCCPPAKLGHMCTIRLSVRT